MKLFRLVPLSAAIYTFFREPHRVDVLRDDRRVHLLLWIPEETATENRSAKRRPPRRSGGTVTQANFVFIAARQRGGKY
jgi:hypothetical protein